MTDRASGARRVGPRIPPPPPRVSRCVCRRRRRRLSRSLGQRSSARRRVSERAVGSEEIAFAPRTRTTRVRRPPPGVCVCVCVVCVDRFPLVPPGKTENSRGRLRCRPLSSLISSSIFVVGTGFCPPPQGRASCVCRAFSVANRPRATTMMNGENGGGGVAKPTPPPTLPKSYTPSAAAAYRLASMERLAQRQRIFEHGGPPPPPPGASYEQSQKQPSPTTTPAAAAVVASAATGPPPPVTAPKPVLGTKASIVRCCRSFRCQKFLPPPLPSFFFPLSKFQMRTRYLLGTTRRFYYFNHKCVTTLPI